MSTSEARIRANQQNARLSTGPKTEAGKGRSRRNALKHGLTGGGIVLADDVQGELEAELQSFHQALKPAEGLEARLVEQAALGSVRRNRVSAALEAHLRRRQRNAVRDWDEARDAEVAALMERLDRDPVGALAGLRRTAEGCDALADAWDELSEALDEQGTWDDGQVRRALRLLGEPALPAARDRTTASALWPDILGCCPESSAAGWDSGFGGAPATLPDPVTARANLSEFIAAIRADLAELGDRLWERHDKPDRDEAPLRALYDDSPEARRLARYEVESHRMMHKALDALAKLRRADAHGLDSPAPRNEPNAPPRRGPVGPPPTGQVRQNEPNLPAIAAPWTGFAASVVKNEANDRVSASWRNSP
jgi:hypothetical protein